MAREGSAEDFSSLTLPAEDFKKDQCHQQSTQA